MHLRKLTLFTLTILFVAAATGRVQAGVITLDMDSVLGGVHGTVLSTQFPGVTITATNEAGTTTQRPVIFDTAFHNTIPGPSRDRDLDDPFAPAPGGDATGAIAPGPSNPGDILVVNENAIGCGDGICDEPDDLGAGSQIIFSFATPVQILGFDLFDLDGTSISNQETALITLIGGPRTATIEGRFVGDSHSASIDAVKLFDPVGTASVTEMRIRFTASGGIDRLRFSVPEPATLALMAVALLALSLAGCHRREPARGRSIRRADSAG